jgi:hypothetical protein
MQDRAVQKYESIPSFSETDNYISEVLKVID